jgi:hypothetical protein
MLGKEKPQSMAPGLIVAAVIAALAGVILLCVALFWLWRRRKMESDNEKYAGSPNGNGSPTNLNRNTSVHSKLGLLDSAYPPTLNTRFSNQNLDFSTDTSSPGSMGARRKSNPLDFDQRLNPSLLMVHDNGSRNSIRTLEDHRDYGRMLKVKSAVRRVINSLTQDAGHKPRFPSEELFVVVQIALSYLCFERFWFYSSMSRPFCWYHLAFRRAVRHKASHEIETCGQRGSKEFQFLEAFRL